MSNAAIYARVSSARQKEAETIGSQTAALRIHAGQLGVELPEEWVFEDEGHSGATLVRPALAAVTIRNHPVAAAHLTAPAICAQPTTFPTAARVPVLNP